MGYIIIGVVFLTKHISAIVYFITGDQDGPSGEGRIISEVGDDG